MPYPQLDSDGKMNLRLWGKGGHFTFPNDYVSGVGIAGVADTAQTILTIPFPANTMVEVQGRLKLTAYFKGEAGGAIVGSLKIGPAGSEVLVADISHGGGAALNLLDAWVQYVDNTHANIIEMENGVLGDTSAANVAGFTWDADQAIIFTQNKVTGQFLTLYSLVVDVLPKGR